MSQNENGEIQAPLFFIRQKVDAFVNSYVPCPDDTNADEIFTDAKLRQYFQAYPRPTGDPLVEYVDELSNYGFHFRTCILGEPAICVRMK